MTRDEANKLCEALPGAEWSEPFGAGHDVWKVGGKIFATIGDDAPGMSLKTPDIETAQMLIEAGVGMKAPYYHRSWVMVPFDDAQEIRLRLDASYDIIRASLPKKTQHALPPRQHKP